MNQSCLLGSPVDCAGDALIAGLLIMPQANWKRSSLMIKVSGEAAGISRRARAVHCVACWLRTVVDCMHWP